MSSNKIVTIIGARPQFVKAAVVSRIVREKASFREVLVHTGQHFDANMSDVFFEEMDIPKPDYHLNINSMSHGKMTGRMMEAIEDVVIKERPDALLVYGDTNSTLAGALVAAKLHIPLAHVEAGLRSFNMTMPEEVNRILTDRVSRWLFCPTITAINNLKKEGYDHFDATVLMTGDVMQDAAYYYARRLNEKPGAFDIPDHPFVLSTIHREENTANPSKLSEIISILNELNQSTPVIMPIHPGTKQKLLQSDLKPKFKLIDPVGYFDMIRLLNNCNFVVTDSGGLQKEAYFFRKYCITLREQTEWTELVDNEVNFICGTDVDKVSQALQKVNSTFPEVANLYGNGHAGELIVAALAV